MEPLLPGEHVSGPLLEQAHDLMAQAQRLNGFCHTAEIEDALKSAFAQDADKARRQHPEPGVLRTQGVSVGRHAAPAHEAVIPMLARWGQCTGQCAAG